MTTYVAVSQTLMGRKTNPTQFGLGMLQLLQCKYSVQYIIKRVFDIIRWCKNAYKQQKSTNELEIQMLGAG